MEYVTDGSDFYRSTGSPHDEENCDDVWSLLHSKTPQHAILSDEKLRHCQHHSLHPFHHQQLSSCFWGAIFTIPHSCLISLDYNLLTTNCNLLKLLSSALSVCLLSKTLQGPPPPTHTPKSSFNWLWASFCCVLLYCCYDNQHWWCKQTEAFASVFLLNKIPIPFTVW